MLQHHARDVIARAPAATVVVAEPLSDVGVQLLKQHGLVVVSALQSSRENLLELLRDADALIVRSETRVDAALLSACSRLRVVGRAGVGVDTIDIDAATAAGVLVLNTPGGNSEAAAEHTMGLMIALLRKFADATATVRSGRWTRNGLVGSGLGEKTLGIVGLGRVGSGVAKRAGRFGMRLLAYDPYVTRAWAAALGTDLVPLGELMARSDVLTIHTPLTAQTYKLIDDRALALMRPGSFIVNCARGGIVDEDALLEALRSGRVAAAALDVLASEPPSTEVLRGELVNHPRVVVTPHVGGSTHEALAGISARLATDMIAALRGELPASAVNRHAFLSSPVTTEVDI